MSTSLYVPPYFDGENYAYWKIRMRAFLKSLDERVWHSVEQGWTKLETSIDAWTKDEISNCNLNSKGLNAIFMAVSPDEFKRIFMCEIAKETWDILEVTHEGTTISFNDFYTKLNDIMNSRIMRKILGSLLKGFRPKVTAIEESKDLDIINVEELIGSL
ncbi:hypothetical protein I3760_11G068100 [Carya illinoinensis]|nr:hypothetical protein I3760_11G068100 [Carya illinoinensis]